jgi:hypothetical protein
VLITPTVPVFNAFFENFKVLLVRHRRSSLFYTTISFSASNNALRSTDPGGDF